MVTVVYRIELPPIDWSEIVGRNAVIPVKVSWPELRLTENQMVANAFARAAEVDEPYPDHSYIDVVVPRPKA